MTRDVRVRLSGVVAILGGGLRVVDGFLNNADIYVQQVVLIFGLRVARTGGDLSLPLTACPCMSPEINRR